MTQIVVDYVSAEALANHIGQLPVNVMTGTMFVGDRASCIEFGTTVVLNDSKIAGLVTVAPDGEMRSGKPTIVGVYVLPEYRRQGYGKAMLQRAVELCVERQLTPIHIDAMSTAVMRLTESLPTEVRQYLEVIDHHGAMDIFGNQ